MHLNGAVSSWFILFAEYATKVLEQTKEQRTLFMNGKNPVEMINHCKQHGHRSDCSIRSSLIRVHSVFFHGKRDAFKYILYMYTVVSEIFANSIERHISDVKNSRLRQGLPISIIDRVILPFRGGYIFTNRENKILAKISEFTV